MSDSMSKSKEQLLIQILLDSNASEAEKDDAAMDLGSFDSNDTVESLFEAAINPENDDMIKASCGESLAQIWLRNHSIDFKKLSKLSGIAFNEAGIKIKSKDPISFEKFVALYTEKQLNV
jgi:hypothetical protein